MTGHRRVGPRELVLLQEGLSDRDLAVLETVERFRLLSARQIERLLFSQHASPLTGARASRRALARLTDQRMLMRLDRRIGGVRAGSASFVYALGPIGHRVLHANSRRRWKEPTGAFVHHTLAVADLAIGLIEAAGGDREVLAVETEPRCWRPFTSGHGTSETLRPDLAVVTADHDSEWRWFVEIDRGTESGSVIRRKSETYDRYWRTGIEQERHDVFPRIAWVTPTLERAHRIHRWIDDTPGINRELFATTPDESAVETLFGVEEEVRS